MFGTNQPDSAALLTERPPARFPPVRVIGISYCKSEVRDHCDGTCSWARAITMR